MQADPSKPADDRYSVSMAVANVVGFLLGLALVVPLVALHIAVAGVDWVETTVLQILANPVVSLLVVIVAVVLHELIHGLCWAALSGNRLGVIKFGFQWKTLTPFAHCKVAIPATAYRIGGVAPGLLVGVLPAVVGTLTGFGPLALLGWFMTVVAGGDALVFWLIRNVPGRELVLDHPTRAGCVLAGPR